MAGAEEKAKQQQVVPAPAEAAPPVVTARMPEDKIAVYRYFLEKDFEGSYFDERNGRFWSGGEEQVKAMNVTLRRAIKQFKEHSAMGLAEYDAKGYLEYCPSPAPSAKRLKQDKDGNKQEQSKL